MIEYWRRLQPRERRMIVLAAAVVALVLAWTLVWEPLRDARRSAGVGNKLAWGGKAHTYRAISARRNCPSRKLPVYSCKPGAVVSTYPATMCALSSSGRWRQIASHPRAPLLPRQANS